MTSDTFEILFAATRLFRLSLAFFQSKRSLCSPRTMSTIEERTTLWLKWDVNPTTRQEIEALVREGKATELKARLDGRLGFGTAGMFKQCFFFVLMFCRSTRCDGGRVQQNEQPCCDASVSGIRLSNFLADL